MKDGKDDILKRYYRGETTLEEERKLKDMFRQGELTQEPVLAFQKKKEGLPEGLLDKIQTDIHERSRFSFRRRIIAVSSLAALLVLIISFRGLMPRRETLQLSDNLKKERFENALKIIGNVIEEKNPPVQKILYEDNKLIIAVE